MLSRSTPLASDHPPYPYVALPSRLLQDCQCNPVAVGVYSLIGRLYLIHQAPIPLSAADLLRYDLTLSYGAARGGLRRLVHLGWLIETPGHKNTYLPSWGRIRGAIRPWRTGAPRLDCPGHQTPLRLDRRLLDVLMGKLVPHPLHPAQITRYLDRPLLGLRDVGIYALALGGLEGTTERLAHYGLVRENQAQPLPPDHQILALASQWLFAEDNSRLTDQGWRMFGIATRSPDRTLEPAAQPLFFVPTSLIGDLIPTLIPDLIPPDTTGQRVNSASQCAQHSLTHQPTTMPGTQEIQANQGIPPLSPPMAGGGAIQTIQMHQEPSPIESVTLSESGQLLREINVMSSNVEKYQSLPPDLVRSAIAHGRARTDVRDLAGWVVHLLAQAHDGQWMIPPVSHGREGMVFDDLNRRYGDLFRRGSDVNDLSMEETPLHVPHGDMKDNDDADEVIAFCDVVRALLPCRCWPLLDMLTIYRDSDVTWVVCPDRRVWCALWDLQGILHDALRDLGVSNRLRLTIAGAEDRVRMIDGSGGQAVNRHETILSEVAAPHTITREAAGVLRPSWIAPASWASLPAPLQTALAGSQLVAGTVRGATAGHQRLLDRCYASQVAELIGDSAKGWVTHICSLDGKNRVNVFRLGMRTR